MMDEGVSVIHIDRMRAAELGRETLQMVRDGAYQTPGGRIVDLRDAIAQAIANTQTYPPAWKAPDVAPGQRTTEVTVTGETTLQAASRLVAAGLRPLALNFASARHPGGGFLSGARAQEESLARSSALYACLEGNPMYAWHEAHRDPFYTDYAIYSPDVPVFRLDNGGLLDEPYTCAFITCPAVNARVALERDRSCHPAIRDAMAQRIGRVLAIAAAQHHTHLILGAWGCGAFGNDTREIAPLFRAALAGPYQGVFASVVFAIAGRSPAHGSINPFEQAFSSGWERGSGV